MDKIFYDQTHMFQKIILYLVLFLPCVGFAKLALPTNLNSAQRTELTYLLGMNTSNKLLTNPFALGGYSGFEFGIGIENLSLAEYSDPAFIDEKQAFAHFSIGKGLYHNVDAFLIFVPPLRQSLISQYGLALKWAFYEANSFPLSFSLTTHTTSSSIDDSLNSLSFGLDLTAGMSIKNIAFYLGIGQARTETTFSGIRNLANFTDTGQQITETATATHSLVGALYQWQIYFLAFQIDRYKNPVYSTKLGVRF